jgi:poly [ADP-ribose] polymerase
MVNTSNHDSESSRLIRSFINENVHSITSNTTIQFTTRGFETPLGPVTESHLDRAGESLNALRDEMNGDESLDGDDRNIRDINSAYYSLIPRRFGSKITTSDMILTPDLLAAEYDLIDNLRTAVQAGLTSGGSADTGVNINVALMDRGHVDWDRLSNKFETTKHRNHAEIKGYRVKNIFYLNIPTATNAFRPVEKRLSNVYELFHGTKTANMLSIALNGLIIPPTGAAHVTGRMFGNGVYGASCSTKALNYAVGYWGGTRNKSNTAYMLITEFAMGNTYIAKSSMNRGAPSGYDSIWAQAGSALLNDEYIVYNLNQVNITHLLELEN